MLQTKLEGPGKAGWLAIALVALWAAWPIAVVVLAYLAASGRLRAWWDEAPGGWIDPRGRAAGASGPGRRGWTVSSGNRTFDDYREETLRHLEDEQGEFHAYLERLRRARDKTEFDRFMAERRGQTEPSQPALVNSAAG